MLLCNFIVIALWRGWSPENLLHIFKTSFPKNTSEGFLLVLLPDRFSFQCKGGIEDKEGRTGWEKSDQTRDKRVSMQFTMKNESSRQEVFCKKNVFKTSSRHLQDALQKRLQDVFKTPSRHIQHVFKTFSRRIIKLNCSCSWPIYSSWPYLFKTSSRRLPKMFSRRLQKVFKISSRRLQDVFKTNHQVKLFLLTRFQDVFETYSKRFWDVLQRRLSIEGFA